MFCHQCGKAQQSEAKFCINCGTRIIVSSDKAPELQQSALEQPVQPLRPAERNTTEDASNQSHRREIPSSVRVFPRTESVGKTPRFGDGRFDEDTVSENYLLRIEVVGSALILVAFFMPWVSIGGLVSMSGYDIPNALSALFQVTKGISKAFGEGEVASQIEKSNVIWMLKLLYVSPALAVCAIVAAVRRSDTFWFGFCAGLFPLLLALYGYVNNQKSIDAKALDALSVGAYLTMLGCIICLASIFRGASDNEPAFVKEMRRRQS